MGALHDNGLAFRWIAGVKSASGKHRETIRLLDRHSGKPQGDNAGDDAPEATAPPAWEFDCAARARDGDAAAFDRLVDAYTGRIHAHLWRMVRSREDAEDLTQETFLRAYRALPRFDPQRPFRNWLYTIATNLGLNAIRTRGRRIQTTSLSLENEERKVRYEPVSHRPHGRAMAERAERAAHVDDAIAKLSPKVAALVRLHYHEEIPLREAGKMVGMGESAAKVALHRARKRIREALLGDETL